MRWPAAVLQSRFFIREDGKVSPQIQSRRHRGFGAVYSPPTAGGPVHLRRLGGRAGTRRPSDGPLSLWFSGRVAMRMLNAYFHSYLAARLQEVQKQLHMRFRYQCAKRRKAAATGIAKFTGTGSFPGTHIGFPVAYRIVHFLPVDLLAIVARSRPRLPNPAAFSPHLQP